MGCWVVPSVAAELWGVPVAHVLEGIQHGVFASRKENGFVLVDSDRARAATGVKPPTWQPAVVPPTVALEPQLLSDRLSWQASRLSAGRSRTAPRRLSRAH